VLYEHGGWLWPFDLSVMVLVLVLNTTCMSSIFVIINLECNSSYSCKFIRLVLLSIM